MAKFALSTLNQGLSAYIALPSFVPNAGAAVGGTSFIEIEFALHAMSDNGIGYIAGHTSTAAQGLSLTASFEPRVVIGSTVRVLGPANTGALDRRDKIRFEYDDTGSGTTAQVRLYYNNAPMGSWTGSINQGSSLLNALGRSTTRYNPITIYRVSAGTLASASYIGEWNDGTATGSGVNWGSSNSSELLTITGHTGTPTNSWWLDYDTVQPERHTAGTILTLPVDFMTGGAVMQRERYTQGTIKQLSPDFMAGGAVMQRQQYSQGAIESVSVDFMAGGTVMQRQHFTQGAIESVSSDFMADGTVMQRQYFTQGAIESVSVDFMAGGTVMQRQYFTQGAITTISADFIAGGISSSGESYVGGSVLSVAADFTAGGTVMQRERYNQGAIESLSVDFTSGGAVSQKERYTGGVISVIAVDFTAGGIVSTGQSYTSGSMLTVAPDFIADGTVSQKERYTGGSIDVLSPDFMAGGVVMQRERYVGGAEITISVETIAGGELHYGQHIVAGSLLPIACDFIVNGQFNQQFNYVGGSILQLNADFMAGGKANQAIKKLRHSGHYVWNNQTKQDQQEFVRQSPDSFTGLLYVVRDAAPVTPEPDQWRDDALFSQPDVNQRVTEYADPVVCYILERPRESMPFDMDMAGENLINEHEDYLTVCVDTDVPTGSALEFEDDLGDGNTRRSWWYVHHSTSLGTTTAGAVYYLIPLRDFTGVNA
jgi:antitoxin component YwqK of YwqJK toxin-antitoxin module